MPRTSNKNTTIAADRPAERAIRVEKTNWWEAVQQFIRDRRTRMILGVLLLTFAVIALLAYISFLFTGTYDQSVLAMDHADRLANRETVRNLLGLPGAHLAQFMIDGSFGFVSILLVFMITIYALRLMHVLKDIHAVKLFCGGSFWVWWGAIVLGFAIPLLICYLLQILRYKIEGHDDVQKLTRLPIVADVAVASDAVKSTAGIVVHENQNNQIDEIFRSMRTNIQFMMKDDQKVILFTSSTSGEGKTFNAANLGVSFALLGKKVILLGLDIRKPALGRLFEISDRQMGITTLLTRSEITESDISKQICPSGVNQNLDLLMAGPIPPNPTELLARPNLGTIINILREKYDYIILDTAPIGLVTDTLQIGRYADVTAFVCRADYTPKNSFAMVNQLSAENKLPNMCVVINGVDMSKKKYGYYYGYGRYGKYGRYGYGYGYGNYGAYGNYAESHYGRKDDNSIKR